MSTQHEQATLIGPSETIGTMIAEIGTIDSLRIPSGALFADSSPWVKLTIVGPGAAALQNLHDALHAASTGERIEQAEQHLALTREKVEALQLKRAEMDAL